MMVTLESHLLSLIIVLPLVAALSVMLTSRSALRWIRVVAGLGTGLPLGLGLLLYVRYRGVGGFEFSDHYSWIESLGISYWVGVDGISLFLLEMTLLLMPVALIIVLAGAGAQLRSRVALMLVLESCLLGSFASLDLFLFYLCFELSGLILYFLMGLEPKQPPIKWTRLFLIFQLLGSGLLLLTWCVLAAAAGDRFNLADLMRHPLGLHLQIVWVTVLLCGLAIKSALIPVHSWFRGVQVRVAPALALIVAGIYLKVGIYGIIRFAYPLLPEGLEDVHEILMNVAMVTVVVAGLLTVAARTLPAALAYMTIAQMGLLTFGIASLTLDGAQGGLFLMVQHGLIMGLLAVCMAVKVRADSPWHRVVLLVTLIACLAAMGMPGTSSFVGFLLVLLGGAEVAGASSLAVLVGWMLMAGALFMVVMRLVRAGESIVAEQASLPRSGLLLTIPLILLILVGGLMPRYFLEKSESSVSGWLAYVRPQHIPDTMTIIRGSDEETVEVEVEVDVFEMPATSPIE